MGVLIISCILSYLNSYLGQLKIWWETTPTRFLRNCKRWVEVLGTGHVCACLKKKWPWEHIFAPFMFKLFEDKFYNPFKAL